MVAEVLKHIPDDSPRYVASAPGRLDVMGGIAEYSGALVLNMTLAHHACVAVQPRADGMISIIHTPGSKPSTDGAIEVPAPQLVGPDGKPVPALGDGWPWGDAPDDAVRCVLGVLVEALRAGLVSDWADGLSIAVDSNLTGLTDAGHNAAVAAAMLAASTQAAGVTPDPLQAVAISQRVENDWLGVPVGTADAVCALLGEPHKLNQLRCEPCTLVDPIPLPDELMLVGVDSGVLRPDAEVKYRRARTAAFMGRVLVDRIIQYEGGPQAPWNGYLARISITDYVERFRDRIPTKLKGSEFLERFGETGDPLTTIEPAFVYKIRSRTEHHIYEHARSCQFVDCLSRSIRNNDSRALAEAGELMYASHWSYGQRCGLGSMETDLLTNLIREHGVKADIYGAKISGRGCGGMVTVLMRGTDRAREALHQALETYESRTGEQPTFIHGSSAGSLVAGAQRM